VHSTKYQHTDALGSPIAVSNEAGTVIERTNYDPYGGPIGKTIDGIGYTGHVMDPLTGLTYMQQRYYDQGVGRFLSVDPVTALDNGDMRHFNRYGYAYNNPYKFVDPDGRAPGSAAKDMGLFIRAAWNSGGDPGEMGRLYREYKQERREADQFQLDVASDLTRVGLVKDAVEVVVEVANEGDATEEGVGALAGELVGTLVENKLDGKIGGDAASVVGAAAGAASGDAVEAGMNSLPTQPSTESVPDRLPDQE
jgi:RHS repeat-associated protein